MTAKVDPLLGSTIGEKYRIVRYLAAGGMGAVYEAVHVVVQRRFAIKFLHPELALRRDALARFKQEATAAGSLENEHIAAVVDFGITPAASPYIVMEYLEGVDLGRLLESEGPLAAPRACDLALQACIGIEKAHARGIIHRDLKPSNLFVCRRGDGTDLLKIMDFGVAKLIEVEASSAVTRTGSIIGTPAYMSPEQARGEGPIDHRADLHALGVILYELLSGHVPHPGESSHAILHHLATQPALPLARSGHDFLPELVAIVERALSTRAAERYRTAAEFAQGLLPFARREVWPLVAPALADSSPEEVGTMLGSVAASPPLEAAPAPRRAFRRGPAVVSALAALGLGGALLLFRPAAEVPAPTPEMKAASPAPAPPPPPLPIGQAPEPAPVASVEKAPAVRPASARKVLSPDTDAAPAPTATPAPTPAPNGPAFDSKNPFD